MANSEFKKLITSANKSISNAAEQRIKHRIEEPTDPTATIVKYLPYRLLFSLCYMFQREIIEADGLTKSHSFNKDYKPEEIFWATNRDGDELALAKDILDALGIRFSEEPMVKDDEFVTHRILTTKEDCTRDYKHRLRFENFKTPREEAIDLINEIMTRYELPHTSYESLDELLTFYSKCDLIKYAGTIRIQSVIMNPDHKFFLPDSITPKKSKAGKIIKDFTLMLTKSVATIAIGIVTIKLIDMAGNGRLWNSLDIVLLSGLQIVENATNGFL